MIRTLLLMHNLIKNPLLLSDSDRTHLYLPPFSQFLAHRMAPYCYEVAQWVKNPPVMQETGDMGLIPGSGIFPEKKMATHSSILVWKVPWTEESGGLQSRRLDMTEHTKTTQEAFCQN